MGLVDILKREARMWCDTCLLPRTCAVCGNLLTEKEEDVCFGCMASLPRHRLTGPELFENPAALTNAPFPVGIVRAWYSYNPSDEYASIIRKGKYDDRPAMLRRMGAIFARDLLMSSDSQAVKGLDVLLPMPMYVLKRMRRGYNQSCEIAAGIGDVLDIPVGDNLVALRGHGTQTRLGFRERSVNIRGCYACRNVEELEGLDVAIVDDVITTGASMSEAMFALAWSGAKPASVSFLALGATV